MQRWTVSQIAASERRISATFNAPDGRVHEVYAEADCELAADATCWLAASLLLAMRTGHPLHIDEPVDAQALSNSAEVQQLLASWFPETLTEVSLDATAFNEPSPRRSAGVGLFFTGGLDSFYTLLKRRSDVTHLIYVVGFDLTDEHPELIEETLRSISAVADEEGIEFLSIRTNLRAVGDAYGLDWYYHFHGAALAFVAHALSPHLERVIISSSDPEDLVEPSGTHPKLDGFWASSKVAVEHYGIHEGRIGKAALAAENPTAMRHLRVCYKNPGGAYNCGKCEKCLRTQINLRIAGAQGRCATLPARIDLARVVSQPLEPNGYAELLVNIDGLKRSGRRDPVLYLALHASLIKTRVFEALRRSDLGPALRRIKRAAKGS